MEGKKCTDEYTEYQEHMGHGDRKQEGWESTHTPGRTVRRVRKGWPLLFAVTHMRHGTGTALSLQECVGKVETQNWTLWNCHSSIFYLKTLQFSVPQSNTFNSKSTSVLTYSQHLFLINLTHSVGILTSPHKRPPFTSIPCLHASSLSDTVPGTGVVKLRTIPHPCRMYSLICWLSNSLLRCFFLSYLFLSSPTLLPLLCHLPASFLHATPPFLVETS